MLTILNDVHIGAERTAGTTKDTRLALRNKLLADFEQLLPTNGDLMLLGDLFDKFTAPYKDIANIYGILNEWLDLRQGSTLYLVAGNHDLSKSTEVFGAFDLLGQLLQETTTNVVVIKQPMMTPHGYVIPHLPDQVTFDAALAEVPECEFLFLHCNYNNFFASQSDQSLNISKEQVDACKAKQIVIAHEHQAKTAGRVCIPGNQIASSISDWLGNKDKGYAVIKGKELSITKCVKQEDEFVELDWTQLEVVDKPFVRVIGEATAEQAAQVVTAIAKYREKSKSLVITNSVKIASNDALQLAADSLEQVQAYSVWSALESVLSSADMDILRKLQT